MDEANAKFPRRDQILSACKFIVSELIPHFRSAVESEEIRADLVDGRMADLIDEILVHNCDSDQRRFLLKTETRRSAEWMKLSREILGAADKLGAKSIGLLPREGGEGREQKASGLAQSAESEFATSTTSDDKRKAFFKPILKRKGLSIHGWARKANVDFHTADNYLKSKTKPRPATLKQLANALDVTVEELPT